MNKRKLVYNEIATKRPKNEKEEKTESGIDPGVDWGKIPDIPLERIFRDLSDQDRFNAELVCARWLYMVRNTSSLWRNKRFKFSGRNPNDLTHTPYKIATQYIKVFGKFLRKLDMQLYSPICRDVCKKFYSCLKVCLNYLIKHKCKLESLALPCLYLERSQWSPSKEGIVDVLSLYFCKCQKTLKRVNLQSARLEFQDAHKILFSLAYNLGCVVEDLDIEDFIRDRSPVYDQQQFSGCLKYFSNLSELCLNYSYLSDAAITTMAENLKPNALKKMYIRVSWQDSYAHPIFGESWGTLSTKCPDLKIYVYFLRVLHFGAHLRVLRPEMAVRQIVFDGSYFYDQDWHICPTLNTILPYYEDSLRRLTLDLPDTMERFEGDLLKAIERCKNLYSLHVTAFISTKFIEKLLEMTEKGQSSIDTLRVKMLISNFNTSMKENDLERIYRVNRNLISEKFYEYDVRCATSI